MSNADHVHEFHVHDDAGAGFDEYQIYRGGMMKRKEILEQAIQCVCHDRQDQHGKPENTFAVIANLWNTYLEATGAPLVEKDVAQMMVLFKIARSVCGNVKDDDYIDAAGYSALAGELVKRPS